MPPATSAALADRDEKRVKGGAGRCADAPSCATGPAALPDGGTPFTRPDWFRLHAEHVWQRPPALPMLRHAGGSVILPLLDQGRGRFASATSWYGFVAGPIFDGIGDDRDRIEALTRLLSSLSRRAARLTLGPLPTHDGQADIVHRALLASGWRVHAATQSWRHALEVEVEGGGGDFAAYWAARPGALRSTVGRRTGRLSTSVSTRFDDAEWAAYETVHDASWKGPEGSPGFLRAFARAEGLAGRLRLGLARTVSGTGTLPPGTIVAAQLWTVERGIAYIHKLAQRRDADALSPGSVLTQRMMRHAIDTDRVAVVDFGTGDEAYKRDWMNRRDPLVMLDAFNAGDRRAWLPYGRSLAGLARRAARNRTFDFQGGRQPT